MVAEKAQEKSGLLHRVQNKVIAGVLTVIPIWVTWLVVDFLLKLLTQMGAPIVRLLVTLISPYYPGFEEWFLDSKVQGFIGILLIILTLYVVGWTASNFVGRHFISAFHRMMERIPMVQTIYTSVRKLIVALQAKPDKVQRVVLIDFPSPEMKTVGLVTRTLKDEATGRDLVAVYVPTTPNPTSGYLEIVPADRVTSTSWSIDEAMAFIISGGAVAPEKIFYDQSAPEE